ncbi:MAG: gamma carbonic anhydrase family protein [Candidatus Micrarchaeota archaeon]
MGKNVYVAAFAAVRADEDEIVIGDCTSIQESCVVHGRGVKIGDYVTIGHGAIVHGCVVSNHVLIGMHATLLNQCQIGEYSIIAAGALVLEKAVIPARSVVMGVPGKVVRTCTEDDVKRIDFSAQSYVDKLKAMGKLDE